MGKINYKIRFTITGASCFSFLNTKSQNYKLISANQGCNVKCKFIMRKIAFQDLPIQVKGNVYQKQGGKAIL